MKRVGIYLIIRKGTANFYVGSSVDVDKRLRQHRRNLRAGTHPNIHLQNAWNLYGEDNFIFELFEEFPEDQVRHFEQVALNHLGKLPFCYNINLDASVPPSQKGKKMPPFSAEHKTKLSEAMKGKNKGKKKPPRSDEHRARMSEALKNKPLSAEHRARISSARKGKVHSPETKARMSEGQRLRHEREAILRGF